MVRGAPLVNNNVSYLLQFKYCLFNIVLDRTGETQRSKDGLEAIYALLQLRTEILLESVD